MEIKQRVDRVTQKRRAILPYADARRLCDDRQIPAHEAVDQAFIEEAHTFLWQYDLRPVSIVRYERQAFIGANFDIGLRVTFDTALTSQRDDLRLHELPCGQPMLGANWAVMEVKVNERLPYWMTELVAAHNLQLIRISKYCRSIEAAKGEYSWTSSDDILNVKDLTAEFSILDVVLVLTLSFLLSAFIGWIYKISHRGTSYSQSFVFTLVLRHGGGARDDDRRLEPGAGVHDGRRTLDHPLPQRAQGDPRCGLHLLHDGDRHGGRDALLSAGGDRRSRHQPGDPADDPHELVCRAMSSQILRIQVINDAPFDTLFNKVFGKYTSSYELISVDSVHSGMLTELTYSIGLQRADQLQEFITELRNLNGHNRVTLTAGYNGTDL